MSTSPKLTNKHGANIYQQNNINCLMITLRNKEGLKWSQYFHSNPITIGRNEHADLTLPYPWISAQHIEIHWSDQGIKVRDLYAKLPARLNGKKLSSQLTSSYRELTLSLPSISLDFSLKNISDEKLNSIPKPADLIKRLWRPESGWLLWSFNQEIQVTLRKLSSSPLAHSKLKSPPKPILPNRWSMMNEHLHRMEYVESNLVVPTDGYYWFINEIGTYELYSKKESLIFSMHLVEATTHSIEEIVSPQGNLYSDYFVIQINSINQIPNSQGNILLKLGNEHFVFGQSSEPPCFENLESSLTSEKKYWWQKLLEAIR